MPDDIRAGAFHEHHDHPPVRRTQGPRCRGGGTGGTTAHNFILEAIAEKADPVEQRAAFHALANQRYAQFLESGKSIPWEEARVYLKDRLTGKTLKRPVARKLDR